MKNWVQGPPIWAIWALVAGFAAVQAIAWTIAGGIPTRATAWVQILTAWAIMIVLALLSTRLIRGLSTRLSQRERAHMATLDEVEQLQMQNAMLQVVARSVDVPLAFLTLAGRIARLVPCDRVGLALLQENGQEFQTYTARVQEEERRTRPRPEVVFKVETTAIGFVVRSREPLLLNDIAEAAPEFLDANVLQTAGFRSALLLPLVSKGRAVGTINVVSRARDAFTQAHIDVLRPVAEIFAVACVAQQLQMMLGKYQTMEAMSEITVSISSEINSALQTIIGHCDLLERGYPDPDLQRDLATVVRQAQRIAELLEKMRSAANERMQEVAETMQGTIPSSPEGFGEREIS